MNSLLVFAVCALLVQGISAATVSPDDQGEQNVLDQLRVYENDVKELIKEFMIDIKGLITGTSNSIEEIQSYQDDKGALAIQLGELASALEASDDVKQELLDYLNMVQMAISSGNDSINDMRQALKVYQGLTEFFDDTIPEEAQEAREEAEEDVQEA